MNIPNEKQVSTVKKYFMEYTVIFLVVCVITLFGLYYNLNNFIVSKFFENTVKMESIIERNTDALNFIKTVK